MVITKLPLWLLIDYMKHEVRKTGLNSNVLKCDVWDCDQKPLPKKWFQAEIWDAKPSHISPGHFPVMHAFSVVLA